MATGYTPGRLVVFFLALLFVSRVVAQDRCPSAPTPLAPDEVARGIANPVDRGFLWRIERDQRVSHLYGTLHIGARNWVFPGARIVSALAQADTVALELDVLDPEIQRAIMAPPGPGEPPVPPLPEALRRELGRSADDLCLPRQLMEQMHPVLQVMTLSLVASRRDGLDASYGSEIILSGVARAMGKPLVSLETPEIQRFALFSGSENEIVAGVEQGLADIESGRARQLTKRLSDAWSASRWEEISSFSEWCACMESEHERHAMRRINDERNPELAAAIDRLHSAGQRVFAAVGTLHMTGPQSLLSLLQEKGYRVTRLLP